MASDHLTPDMRYGPLTRTQFGALAPVPENGIGFGLGFAVRTQPGRNPLPGSVGDYSWSGVSGTYFWIDPKQQLIKEFFDFGPACGLKVAIRSMIFRT